MKKSKLAQYAVLPVMGLALLGIHAGVSQAATDGTQTNPMSNLVNAIAQKFNLSTTDVQQVFDEQRTQMGVQRQQEFRDRLSQAVTDGKLTQTQADLITAKMTELEANKQSLEGKTEEEKRTAVKSQMDSLQTWITENNIPREFVPFGGGRGGKRGHGGFRKGTPPQTDASSNTNTDTSTTN